MIEFLDREGYLELGGNVRNRSQSLNKKFRERYRKKLEDKWNFVFLKGETRARKIGVTEKGKQYLKMFEYLV